MKLKLLFGISAIGLISTSCVDDLYDLSDVDTTSRVEVNDLVIPVNFGDVKLSDIIKLDDNSDLEIVDIDGTRYYAVKRNGTFESDPILISSPHATKPTLESKQAVLTKNSEGVFEIPNMGNDFTFSCNNVDKSIVEITNVKVNDLKFSATFTTPGIYTNIRMQLPLAMTGTASVGSYDASTGVWTIPSLNVAGTYTATFTAQSIDFTKNDFTFVSPKFDFTSNYSILGGEITAEGNTLDFKVDFNISDLNVESFSGKIKYSIEGMEIDGINLDNLPTFLQGEKTNISLINPLLCINTTNPVGNDKLEYSSALSLTAVRNQELSKKVTSDVFTIGYNNGVGPYNTILSPEKPVNSSLIPQDYIANYSWTAFPGLGDILEGEGLPNSINIDCIQPMIPEQKVNDFVLGRNIPGVKGNYELFAPMALKEGSIIVYNDTKDNWGEDVNYLTITKLSLTATGTNNSPLDAQLTIYPVNSKGEKIQGVEFTSTTLPAGAKNEPISFTLTGVITDMDGVIFEAVIISQDDQIISPDQTIVFSDIRAKVTGYYEKKL